MKVTEKYPEQAVQSEGLGKTKSAKKSANANASGETRSANSVSSDGDMSSAKVKLSERAQDMKKIRERIDSTPDVDEAKVAKYKSMLQNGTYKVDAKAVADKMVDEHAKQDFFAAAAKDE
jgi:negative regulator of flagellin synthesis FlgM